MLKQWTQQIAQVAEVNMGLTSAMVGYEFSESTPFYCWRTSVMAGPSGSQGLHPLRQGPWDQQSISVSSLRHTESQNSWDPRFWGGAGSHGAAREADNGAARGADNRAAGGADGRAAGGGAAEDPPPPLDPPPSDHGGARGWPTSRWQKPTKELEFLNSFQINEPKNSTQMQPKTLIAGRYSFRSM